MNEVVSLFSKAAALLSASTSDERMAYLLHRDPIMLDLDVVSPFIEGKTVLVTGGGGSIGSEICRQLIPAKPRQIVIFDIYENTAYELLRELEADAEVEGIGLCVEIGSIRDPRRLETLFGAYRPDIVFHAAAHKHVPLMEHNPREAVLNNIVGTRNVVERACEDGVGSFVFISTDKAVNPTSVMGATKRVGEMLVQACSRASSTSFSAVRFGNVLGSHGSVLPLFERQLAQGGPITVTHRDIERFFMTIPEAARLVVTAGAIAEGGEIFILDMGSPVRIYDLAERFIKMHGFEPHEDIKIEIVGLRPGEKLYEELFMDGERSRSTRSQSIMISELDRCPVSGLDDAVSALESAARADDADAIRSLLSEVVGTYQPEAGKR